jgi:hypothetical protein
MIFKNIAHGAELTFKCHIKTVTNAWVFKAVAIVVRTRFKNKAEAGYLGERA